MRKLLLCTLLTCALPLYAENPWGIIGDYDFTSARAEQGQTTPYAMTTFWAGKPYRIMVLPRPKDDAQKARLQQIFTDAFRQWFANAATFIRRDNRTEEFGDVLPFLETPVKIEIVTPPSDADLLILEPSAQKKPTDRAHYSRTEYTRPAISLEKPLSSANDSTLLHELGHALGLDDQYEVRRNRAHPVYSSTKAQESIMNHQNGGLTCDDADGVINLLDVTRKQFHGGKNGWKSFCPKSKDVYVNAVPLEKGPYLIQRASENYFSTRVLTEVKKGEVQSRQTLPFDLNSRFDPFQPLKYNTQQFGFGGIVKGETKNKEDVYIMHMHDLEWAIVVKNGKILFEQQYTKLPQNQRLEVTYGRNGKLNYLKKEQDEYSRTVSVVFLGDVARDDDDYGFVAELVLDRKGHVLKENWAGDFSSLVSADAGTGGTLQGNVQNALAEQEKANLRTNLIKHANDFPR